MLVIKKNGVIFSYTLLGYSIITGHYENTSQNAETAIVFLAMY